MKYDTTNCGAREHENLRDVKMAEDSKVSGQRSIYSLLEVITQPQHRALLHSRKVRNFVVT
jgi:hypothetical protein